MVATAGMKAHSITISWKLFIVGAATLGVVLGLLTTPYMGVAGFNYFLLLSGFFLRRQRLVHARLMTLGIASDLSLVLLLELQRGAIGVTLHESLSLHQYLHIGFSTTAAALYLPILYLGFRLLKFPNTSRHLRSWHLHLGSLALVLRTLGFLFMFSLLDRV